MSNDNRRFDVGRWLGGMLSMASDGERHPELIAQFVSNLTGQQFVFVPPSPSNRTDEVETMGTDEVETMGSYFQRPSHNACNSSAAHARTSITNSNTTTNNIFDNSPSVTNHCSPELSAASIMMQLSESQLEAPQLPQGPPSAPLPSNFGICRETSTNINQAAVSAATTTQTNSARGLETPQLPQGPPNSPLPSNFGICRETFTNINQTAVSAATTTQTNSARGPLYDAPDDSRFPQGNRDYSVPIENFHLSYKMIQYSHKQTKEGTREYYSCVGNWQCNTPQCNFGLNPVCPRGKHVKKHAPSPKPVGNDYNCVMCKKKVVFVPCQATAVLTSSRNKSGTRVQHKGHHYHRRPHEDQPSKAALDELSNLTRLNPEATPRQVGMGNTLGKSQSKRRTPARQLHPSLGNADRLAYHMKKTSKKDEIDDPELTFRLLHKLEADLGIEFVQSMTPPAVVIIQFPWMAEVARSLSDYPFQTDSIEDHIVCKDYPNMVVTITSAHSDVLGKHVPVLVSITYGKRDCDYEAHFMQLLKSLNYDGYCDEKDATVDEEDKDEEVLSQDNAVLSQNDASVDASEDEDSAVDASVDDSEDEDSSVDASEDEDSSVDEEDKDEEVYSTSELKTIYDAMLPENDAVLPQGCYYSTVEHHMNYDKDNDANIGGKSMNKRRKIVVDENETELTSEQMNSMINDTSDIVLQNVPNLADWSGEDAEEEDIDDGICPALQKLSTENLLARPCIGDDGGLAPELLALWGRNTCKITGKAGTQLPFRMRGKHGEEQRRAIADKILKHGEEQRQAIADKILTPPYCVEQLKISGDINSDDDLSVKSETSVTTSFTSHEKDIIASGWLDSYDEEEDAPVSPPSNRSIIKEEPVESKPDSAIIKEEQAESKLDEKKDDFDKNDKVLCYYMYMDEETGEDAGGAWLSAVIIKKICTTTQGNIGNGKYITYDKDTYIIKYDYDGQYDINRPTRMIQRRSENVDSQAEDYPDPQDPFPPLCFFTLPKEYVDMSLYTDDEQNSSHSEEEEEEAREVYNEQNRYRLEEEEVFDADEYREKLKLLTVEALKVELRKLNLKVGGRKNELIERLVDLKCKVNRQRDPHNYAEARQQVGGNTFIACFSGNISDGSIAICNGFCQALRKTYNLGSDFEFDKGWFYGCCMVHFKRSVSRVGGNHSIVPIQRKELFYQYINTLTDENTTKKDFDHAVTSMKKDFPYIKNWIDWYLDTVIGSLIFPALGAFKLKGQGNNTNGQEGKGRWTKASHTKSSKATPEEALRAIMRECLYYHEQWKDERSGRRSNYGAKSNPKKREEERAIKGKKKKKQFPYDGTYKPPERTSDLIPKAKRKAGRPRGSKSLAPSGRNVINLRLSIKWSINQYYDHTLMATINGRNTCALDVVMMGLFLLYKYDEDLYQDFRRNEDLCRVLDLIQNNRSDNNRGDRARVEWIMSIIDNVEKSSILTNRKIKQGGKEEIWDCEGNISQQLQSLGKNLFKSKVQCQYSDCYVATWQCPYADRYERIENGDRNITETIELGIPAGSMHALQGYMDVFYNSFGEEVECGQGTDVPRDSDTGGIITSVTCAGNRGMKKALINAPILLNITSRTQIVAEHGGNAVTESVISKPQLSCMNDIEHQLVINGTHYSLVQVNLGNGDHFRSVTIVMGKYLMFDGLWKGDRLRWKSGDTSFEKYWVDSLWYKQYFHSDGDDGDDDGSEGDDNDDNNDDNDDDDDDDDDNVDSNDNDDDDDDDDDDNDDNDDDKDDDDDDDDDDDKDDDDDDSDDDDDDDDNDLSSNDEERKSAASQRRKSKNGHKHKAKKQRVSSHSQKQKQIKKKKKRAMGVTIDRVHKVGSKPRCCYCRSLIRRKRWHAINKTLYGNSKIWKKEYHYHFQCAAQTLKRKQLRQLCTIMRNSTEVRLSKKTSKEFKAELKRRGEYRE